MSWPETRLPIEYLIARSPSDEIVVLGGPSIRDEPSDELVLSAPVGYSLILLGLDEGAVSAVHPDADSQPLDRVELRPPPTECRDLKLDFDSHTVVGPLPASTTVYIAEGDRFVEAGPEAIPELSIRLPFVNGKCGEALPKLSPFAADAFVSKKEVGAAERVSADRSIVMFGDSLRVVERGQNLADALTVSGLKAYLPPEEPETSDWQLTQMAVAEDRGPEGLVVAVQARFEDPFDDTDLSTRKAALMEVRISASGQARVDVPLVLEGELRDLRVDSTGRIITAGPGGLLVTATAAGGRYDVHELPHPLHEIHISEDSERPHVFASDASFLAGDLADGVESLELEEVPVPPGESDAIRGVESLVSAKGTTYWALTGESGILRRDPNGLWTQMPFTLSTAMSDNCGVVDLGDCGRVVPMTRSLAHIEAWPDGDGGEPTLIVLIDNCTGIPIVRASDGCAGALTAPDVDLVFERGGFFRSTSVRDGVLTIGAGFTSDAPTSGNKGRLYELDLRAISQ